MMKYFYAFFLLSCFFVVVDVFFFHFLICRELRRGGVCIVGYDISVLKGPVKSRRDITFKLSFFFLETFLGRFFLFFDEFVALLTNIFQLISHFLGYLLLTDAPSIVAILSHLAIAMLLIRQSKPNFSLLIFLTGGPPPPRDCNGDMITVLKNHSCGNGNLVRSGSEY